MKVRWHAKAFPAFFAWAIGVAWLGMVLTSGSVSADDAAAIVAPPPVLACGPATLLASPDCQPWASTRGRPGEPY